MKRRMRWALVSNKGEIQAVLDGPRSDHADPDETRIGDLDLVRVAFYQKGAV